MAPTAPVDLNKITPITTDAAGNPISGGKVVNYDPTSKDSGVIDFGNGKTSAPPVKPTPQPTIAQLYGGATTLDQAAAQADAARTAAYDPATIAANEGKTRSEVLSQYQSELDSLDQAAAEARARITTQFAPIAAGRVGQTTALNARRGLSGSDFGSAATDTTNKANADELSAKIADSDAIYSNQRSSLIQFIAGEADKEIALRQDASQKGADAKISEIQNRTQRAQSSAQASVKAMIAAGVTDSSNPNYSDSINQIATNTGLTKDQVTSLFTDAKITAAQAAAAAQKAAAEAAAAGRTSVGAGDVVLGPDGKPIGSNPKTGATTDAFGNPLFYTESGAPGKGGGPSGGGTAPSPVTLPPSSNSNTNAPTKDPNDSHLPVAQTILGKTYDKNGDPTSGTPAAPAENANAPFEEYGLLSKTDFNPKDQTDQLAQLYLDKYIKSGDVPTASTMGRSIKPGLMAAITSRAADLYYKATGNPLPNPNIIKAQQDIIAANYKLGNNLSIQEGTVKDNINLSLDNMTKSGLNSSGFKPLDELIDNIKGTLQDPNVGQFLAQNSTIQNELGSLLAVKNAGGTTVYDKLTSAGIISSGDSKDVIQKKVNALIAEAGNLSKALTNANGTAYGFTDPLLQDPNNPARAAYKNGGTSSNSGSATNIDSLRTKYNY